MRDRSNSKESLSFGMAWPGSPVEQKRQPASVPSLLEAMQRVHAEAEQLAERAYDAIQHHAFDPFREFCEKRTEYEALISVLRSRVGPKPRDPRWPAAIDKGERDLLALSIKACVKFCFALSANPMLPIGVLETFLNEVEMLKSAREQLTPIKDQEGISGLLDEIDMALMILEEIVGNAPALEEF